jgi:[ribosomal protein S18]-alanine N-acetyltransferase
MLIRPYTAADRQDCIAAFKSNMPKFFAPDELVDFENWLQHIIQAPNEQYYIAEREGKVIACGGFSIYPDKNLATMTWGLVHNSLHKKGIGKALLLHRIKVIRSTHPQCTIGLDTTQHAFPFFEKLGFITTKITKDSYGEGLDRYDMELNPV